MSSSIRIIRWLLVAFFASCSASAVPEEELRGEVRGRVSIPPKFQQGLSRGQGLSATRVILDGGRSSALPTADGHFLISDVPAGAHLLQVVHPTLRFDPVRIETAAKSGALKMTAYLADLEHGRGAKLKYPLGLAPSEFYQYLEQREEFNLFSIFKSPMTLLSLFSFGAMFLLPKLQPMLEEEKEKQKKEEAKKKLERAEREKEKEEERKKDAKKKEDAKAKEKTKAKPAPEETKKRARSASPVAKKSAEVKKAPAKDGGAKAGAAKKKEAAAGDKAKAKAKGGAAKKGGSSSSSGSASGSAASGSKSSGSSSSSKPQAKKGKK